MSNLSEQQITHCLNWIASPANEVQRQSSFMAVIANFRKMNQQIAELKVQVALLKATGSDSNGGEL